MYWMKQLLTNKTNSSRTYILFLTSILRFYLALKVSIEHNSARENLFSSAFHCWYDRISLRELDKKVKFARIIGCGASYSEFLFCHFKVFRVRTKVHDGARTLQQHSGMR